MKKVLLFVMPLFSLAVSAYDVKIGGIYYNLNYTLQTAEVTSYGSPESTYDISENKRNYRGRVIIPSSVSYDGRSYTVNTIGYAAFWGCDDMTFVVIPNSITIIADQAFWNCSGLTSIDLPSSLTKIGSSAFVNCPNISSVSVPNTLADVGYQAFGGTQWLSNALSTANNGDVIYMGNVAYTYKGSLQSLTLSSNVIGIAGGAFEDCSSLTSVTIPSSIKHIGQQAFYNCPNLTIVKNDASTAQSINANCFSNYSSCTLFVSPEGFSSFLQSEGWKNFQEICVVRTDDECTYKLNKVGTYTISPIDGNKGTMGFWSSGCMYACREQIKNVIIENGVTNIASDAFSRCENLQTVSIPNSVVTIGSGAFYQCSKICTLNIPSSVESIGHDAFNGCSSLSNITFEDGSKPIQMIHIYFRYDDGELRSSNTYYNYYNCPLQTVYIGRNFDTKVEKAIDVGDDYTSVESYYFGPEAFRGAFDTVRDVTLGSSVSKANYLSLFTNLQAVTVTNTNTHLKVDGNAVYNWDKTILCSYYGSESFEIPNGVTIIQDSAFYSNNRVTAVSIPQSVTSIGKSAFYDSNSLTTVTVDIETPLPISSETFSNKTNATLYVPHGCKAAYEAAYYWKDFKSIVEMSPTEVEIPISDVGIGTYCSEFDLDFTDTDVKAYIVSAFSPNTGKAILTRIYDVPANTGIVVLGEAGHHQVPVAEAQTIVSNMLVGVTEATELNGINGDNTNYVFAETNGELGFCAVADGTTLDAHKTYLPLPTDRFPSSADMKISFVFCDEEAGESVLHSADVNGDGVVDVADIATIISVMASKSREQTNATDK